MVNKEMGEQITVWVKVSLTSYLYSTSFVHFKHIYFQIDYIYLKKGNILARHRLKKNFLGFT